ncbi:hypothetical protein [Treponema phagedenis]|uniref:hypothetical protein n=1 Tax=Treponema phagedenis TaxID=162 RepID=UPI0019808557|nr:hypothetical protein [Treponema phagedenis]
MDIVYHDQKQNTRENTAYIKIKNAHPYFNHHFHFLKEPDTAQGRRFAFFPFASPTSLKASILQNSVDALARASKLTIGMLIVRGCCPLAPGWQLLLAQGVFRLCVALRGGCPLDPGL